MDCACGLRCRGFPKILWDSWQTSIHCEVLQKIVVSTKLECVGMYQLRGYGIQGLDEEHTVSNLFCGKKKETQNMRAGIP